MTSKLKRVSILLTDQQHTLISKKDLNLSGLVRDLLDDHFSDHKVTVAVSEETKNIYDTIVSNTGSSDKEVEKYLKKALKSLLQEKIEAMNVIKDSL